MMEIGLSEVKVVGLMVEANSHHHPQKLSQRRQLCWSWSRTDDVDLSVVHAEDTCLGGWVSVEDFFDFLGLEWSDADGNFGIGVNPTDFDLESDLDSDFSHLELYYYCCFLFYYTIFIISISVSHPE